jgi:hypothetical protein
VLELGEDAEHLEHHLPGGVRGVEGLRDALERDAVLGELVHHPSELADLAREAVHAGDKERVEGFGLGVVVEAVVGKQGILVTEGKPEASLAFELLETRTDNWLTSGWSLDAVTTPTRGGLGVAKDLYKGAGLEVGLNVRF